MEEYFEKPDLLDWGFEDGDFPFIAEEETMEDGDAGDGSGKTDIVLGDLIEIGEHRLICGDSTRADHVAILSNGNSPSLMVTDPPYGVNYDPTWRHKAGINNSSRKGKVVNDDRAGWRDAYALFTGNIAYVWCASQRSAEVHADLLSCNFIPYYQIIWNKQQAAFGRGDYHWKHEPCWYVVRRGEKHNWSGGRKQTTVWDITSILQASKQSDEDAAEVHSTQKPIECMARPMRNNSKPGDIVYDPFLGSGTTMVAAQQLGRICYGIEISPQYCQIIIDRMQKNFPELKIKINGKKF